MEGPRNVIQSEESQKEKNKYCMLIHIRGTKEGGIDLICKAEIRDTGGEQTFRH